METWRERNSHVVHWDSFCPLLYFASLQPPSRCACLEFVDQSLGPLLHQRTNSVLIVTKTLWGTPRMSDDDRIVSSLVFVSEGDSH